MNEWMNEWKFLYVYDQKLTEKELRNTRGDRQYDHENNEHHWANATALDYAADKIC